MRYDHLEHYLESILYLTGRLNFLIGANWNRTHDRNADTAIVLTSRVAFGISQKLV